MNIEENRMKKTIIHIKVHASFYSHKKKEAFSSRNYIYFKAFYVVEIRELQVIIDNVKKDCFIFCIIPNSSPEPGGGGGVGYSDLVPTGVPLKPPNPYTHL